MSNPKPVRVRLMYHDPLVCSGLTAILGAQHDVQLLHGEPALPDEVVLADYEQGMALIGQRPKVLILTARESEWEIRRALEKGARGYLILGCGLDEIVESIRAVHRGMRHICAPAARRLADSVACASLTGREEDVLRLVAEGLCNKAVARELDIAIGTVKSHLKAIFEKLGAKSRTEVATVAERRGLLALPFRTMGRNAGPAPGAMH